ncbi:hypothetical protein A2U01_0103744, partial [Trifolium medium]|nr:hypothetical protein [Trifolium medium]
MDIMELMQIFTG